MYRCDKNYNTIIYVLRSLPHYLQVLSIKYLK